MMSTDLTEDDELKTKPSRVDDVSKPLEVIDFDEQRHVQSIINQ